MANTKWAKIRNEYVTTKISKKKLAEKHRVKYGTLKSRATLEKWGDLRKETYPKVIQKSANISADITAEKEALILSAMDDVAVAGITLILDDLKNYKSLGDTHDTQRIASIWGTVMKRRNAERENRRIVGALEDLTPLAELLNYDTDDTDDTDDTVETV